MNSELIEKRAHSKERNVLAIVHGTLWRWMAVPTAYVLMVLLMKWPETAARAVRAAMQQWYHSVLPALFPFMILMPMITGAEAACIYEKMLGQVMNRVFALPGCAAPAIVTAMIAGSPAGAIASARIAEQAGMSSGQLLRLAGCVCGMSPAFLVSGIGAGILGDVNAGVMLLKTQMLSQIIMLIATRRYSGGERIQPNGCTDGASGNAVGAVLSVAGYMAFFNVIAEMISRVSGGGVWNYSICLLEVTAGAGYLAGKEISRSIKMIILAGMCGFGGVSICAQNMKILKKYGISTGGYIKWRVSAAAISAAVMIAQMWIWNHNTYIIRNKWLETASLFVILMAVPTIKVLSKPFLNKKDFEDFG